MRRAAKEKQDRATLAKFSFDELQAAFLSAQTDPECRLLNEVEAAANQKEAGELLATEYWRGLLTQIEIGRRPRLMREVARMILEKPIT